MFSWGKQPYNPVPEREPVLLNVYNEITKVNESKKSSLDLKSLPRWEGVVIAQDLHVPP